MSRRKNAVPSQQRNFRLTGEADRVVAKLAKTERVTRSAVVENLVLDVAAGRVLRLSPDAAAALARIAKARGIAPETAVTMWALETQPRADGRPMAVLLPRGHVFDAPPYPMAVKGPPDTPPLAPPGEQRDAAWVREQRVSANLSQGKLAERLGVKRSRVASLEQGHAPLTDAMRARVLEACGGLK